MSYQYLSNIKTGRGKNQLYIYSVVHCPNLLMKIISKKLELYRKNNYISSFLIKPILNRIYFLGIIQGYFQPTFSYFRELLRNKIPVNIVTLWKNDWHQDRYPTKFKLTDTSLLRFLSVIQTNNLTSYGTYGCFFIRA